MYVCTTELHPRWPLLRTPASAPLWMDSLLIKVFMYLLSEKQAFLLPLSDPFTVNNRKQKPFSQRDCLLWSRSMTLLYVIVHIPQCRVVLQATFNQSGINAFFPHQIESPWRETCQSHESKDQPCADEVLSRCSVLPDSLLATICLANTGRPSIQDQRRKRKHKHRPFPWWSRPLSMLTRTPYKTHYLMALSTAYGHA
jgi:hypothetical protein